MVPLRQEDNPPSDFPAMAIKLLMLFDLQIVTKTCPEAFHAFS